MRVAYVATGVSGSTLRALNYTPEVAAFRRNAGNGESVPLVQLTASMGDCYGKVFTRYDCTPQHGVELLGQGDMFSSEPVGRFIRADVLSAPDAHLVARLDVLLAAAGTLGETELFGRSIVADGRLDGKLVSQHTVKVRFIEPEGDAALYCYAFLNSGIGLRAVRATACGTKILSLREDLLASLPIPMPAEAIRRRIADLVRATVRNRDEFQAETSLARQVVEALPVMREAARANRGGSRCVAWRGPLPTLTGWTYASAGEALRVLTECWGTRVADLSTGISRGGRDARVRCQAPHGVDFLSQRDLFSIRAVPQRVMTPPQDSFVARGTLLISGDGQLTEGSLFGKVTVAGDELAGVGITSHAVRLVAKEGYSELLYAYLSSSLGHTLLRSTATGTSIPSMRLDLVTALPAPEVDDATLARVTTHVRAAMSARAAAGAAEREAIRIVEEEVLPEWLA